MENSRAWLQFIPFPIDTFNSSPANIEHLPITTRKGRVVYNRKPHQFSRADATRVLGRVFLAPGEPNTLPFWLRLLEQVTIWMLDKILEFISQAKVPDQVATEIYRIAQRMLARVIDYLLPDDKENAANFVSGGAH